MQLQNLKHPASPISIRLAKFVANAFNDFLSETLVLVGIQLFEHGSDCLMNTTFASIMGLMMLLCMSQVNFKCFGVLQDSFAVVRSQLPTPPQGQLRAHFRLPLPTFIYIIMMFWDETECAECLLAEVTFLTVTTCLNCMILHCTAC